ncbi:unnamed protein product [Caenorhabditis sp. 36 PRJEB53466]|nr:unnamed protein product [Caenorhabditis sp. 36 PRJEB53466]
MTAQSMLALDFPRLNENYISTQTDAVLVLKLLPMEWRLEEGKLSAEEKLSNAERFHKYYDFIGCHLNWMLYFKHCDLMEPFVASGQVTTRHDINAGFIHAICQALVPPESNDSVMNIIKNDHKGFICHYEILRMPDIDIAAGIQAVIERYPPSEAVKTSYDSLRQYIHKLLAHLPDDWKFIYRSSSPSPRAPKPSKPFLRVFEFGAGGSRHVFVSEVQWVVNTLKKATCKLYTYTFHNHFFPHHLLDHALGLFGFQTNDVELVLVKVARMSDQEYVPFVGPHGYNVITSVNRFFNVAISYGRTESKERAGFARSFMEYLTVGSFLPYIVTYTHKEIESVNDIRLTFNEMKAFDKKPPKKRKCTPKRAAEKEPPARQISNIPIAALKKFPSNCSKYAMKMLLTYPHYALFLHEQGFCVPGEFCYAKLFEVDAPIAACQLDDDSLKKRVEFYLTKKCYTSAVVTQFRKKINNEYERFPLPERKEVLPTPIEKDSERVFTPIDFADEPSTSESPLEVNMETDVPSTSSDTPETGLPGLLKEDAKPSNSEPPTGENGDATPPFVERRDSGHASTSSLHSSKSPTPAANPVADTGGTGTRHYTEKQKKALIENKLKEIQNELNTVDPRLVEKIYYGQLLNDGEQKEMEAKHKKEVAALKDKMKQATKTVETQKAQLTELKEGKQHFEKLYEETVRTMGGEVKRKDAELKRKEEEIVELRTKQVFENPEASQEKKTSRARKQTEPSETNAKLREGLATLTESNSTLLAASKVSTQVMDGQRREIKELKHRVGQLDKEKATIKQENASLTTRLAVQEEKTRGSVKQERSIKQQNHLLWNELNQLRATVTELHEKIANLEETKELLVSAATPTCMAAIRRIEFLQGKLKSARQDELRYEQAERQMLDYSAMESSNRFNEVSAARWHLNMARAAKEDYEQKVYSRILQLRRNISESFMFSESEITFTLYPDPFTPETVERINELTKIYEQKQKNAYRRPHQ